MRGVRVYLCDVSVGLPEVSNDDSHWVSQDVSTQSLYLLTERGTEQQRYMWNGKKDDWTLHSAKAQYHM